DRAVTGILQEGVDRGDFELAGPPHVLTKALIGMANWTHRWYRSGGRLSAAEIAETFTRTFLHGGVRPPDTTPDAAQEEHRGRSTTPVACSPTPGPTPTSRGSMPRAPRFAGSHPCTGWRPTATPRSGPSRSTTT